MRLILVLFLILALQAAHADTALVAVASNFREASEDIAEQFMVETGYAIRISTGSTGKLYAQIVNGAPFDVFLAADSERPRRLEAEALGVAGTRVTYAIGRLVLWSRNAAYTGQRCDTALADLDSGKLTIANPATAPYGLAAREFLQSQNLWDGIRANLVFGENVAQAMQFAATGNAQLGLVSRSLALDSRLPEATCAWLIPARLHQPIEQQAIKIRRASDGGAADAFLAFLRHDAARRIIERHGYEVPE